MIKSFSFIVLTTRQPGYLEFGLIKKKKKKAAKTIMSCKNKTTLIRGVACMQTQPISKQSTLHSAKLLISTLW